MKYTLVLRQVHKAIAFARKAHRGQLRKTGDPYLTHCINTAKILAALLPSTGKKPIIDTLISGILHDVVDDTSETLHTIHTEFGQDVAKLVAGVSRLSYINQVSHSTKYYYFIMFLIITTTTTPAVATKTPQD